MRMTGLALAFAVLVLSPRGLAATGAADPAPAAAPPTVSAPAMEGEPMAVVGVGGSFRCADFVQAIAAERQGRPPGGDPNHFWTAFFGALMGWADGYVTAKNEDDRLHRLAGSGTNLEQRARWLELFCRANPDAPFLGAAYALRQHLVAEGL